MPHPRKFCDLLWSHSKMPPYLSSAQLGWGVSVRQPGGGPGCPAWRSRGQATWGHPGRVHSKGQFSSTHSSPEGTAAVQLHLTSQLWVPFSFSLNDFDFFSLRLVWSSLLPGKLSEWHFPYKQEECVWSWLKCAGVDRGCESVEASDEASQWCFPTRHPAGLLSAAAGQGPPEGWKQECGAHPGEHLTQNRRLWSWSQGWSPLLLCLSPALGRLLKRIPGAFQSPLNNIVIIRHADLNGPLNLSKILQVPHVPRHSRDQNQKSYPASGPSKPSRTF